MKRFDFIHQSLLNKVTIVRLDSCHWEVRAVDIIGSVRWHGQLSCKSAAVAMGRILERSFSLQEIEVFE